MEEVHIQVIFFDKSFIKFFTEWADFIILLDFIFIFWNLDELILDWLNLILLWGIFSHCIGISFRFYGLFVIISIIPISCLHLFFNSFDDLRPYIFQKWLYSLISYLICYSTYRINGCCSNLIIFVIDIFHNIIYNIFIISSQLILTNNLADHFQLSC